MPAGLKDPVLDLRNSLRGALHDSFVAPVWGAPEVMHQAPKEVKKRFDSAEASVSEKSCVSFTSLRSATESTQTASSWSSTAIAAGSGTADVA